jgi:hypothetical protein
MRARLKDKAIYIATWLIGFAIMPWAVKWATEERGYAAIGGEFLIPLGLFVLVALVKQVSEEVRDGG